ncbi:Bacterial transferase hexapeptide (six repeats), putative [Angomonas deanei]|uniref:Bacterial transferase hexapeptide (Six repeats), putative n=1 Tax=Angomonas deanei TaxID=59799 RepID=A0A7G2CG19_9TRYP|nr:Bacterial transferase hexapeptide (six repeats), putative [Angomonas deanei]
MRRTRTIPKYAATLLCTAERATLLHTLNNVLVSALAEGDDRGSVDDFSSAFYQSGSPNHLGDSVPLPLQPFREKTVPRLPKDHHTMFVIDKKSGVVQHMSRFDNSDDAPEPPTITFSKKRQLSVRMDLVSTGFLFCSCEALQVIEFHVNNIYTFLTDSLLAKVEIMQNVFGVVELPVGSVIVEPITSAETYIAANISVCSRRLYPLTRESCFAEEEACYAVSSTSESVYLHSTVEALHKLTGPNVVIGPNTTVAASSSLSGVVCGANVSIGENCTIVSSVIMDGAVIGDDCVVRGSVVGPGVVIRSGVEVVHSVLGEECKVSAVGDGKHFLHNQHMFVKGTKDGEHSGSSSSNSSMRHSHSSDDTEEEEGDDSKNPRKDGTLMVGVECNGTSTRCKWENDFYPTCDLFTNDPIPQDDDDEESEEEEETYQQAIKRIVDTCFNKPDLLKEENYAAMHQQMSSVNVDMHKGRHDLSEAITTLLLQRALDEERSPSQTLELVKQYFTQWFLVYNYVHLDGSSNPNIDAMKAMLESVCFAIGDPTCVLHKFASSLFDHLLKGCNAAAYKERGFCIVSEEALVDFLADTLHKNEVRAAYEDDIGSDSSDEEDRNMLMVALSTQEYIEKIKKNLKS